MTDILSALYLRATACGFTDFREELFSPERSRENRAHVIAPRLKAEAAGRGSLIEILRQGGLPDPLDFSTALRLHLLGLGLPRCAVQKRGRKRARERQNHADGSKRERICKGKNP